ncbi:response regulator transcription factor [Burkholderia ubonensis]|uniref:response regulator transcription factor n=1 Tax=Burkholderia ubonensis TaxID=101571 RepID=UPI0007C6A555|nr:response regulator transcription factor [Burkholderia ubonensis]
MHAAPTKIVIADSQPATISGVVYELQRDPCLQVIGTARSPRVLIEMLEGRECDVVVTDYTMSSGREVPGDGLEMLSLIQRDHPGVGLVVFTMIENPAVISYLLARGLSCIFSKRDDLDEMPAAVRAAEAKNEYLSPVIASTVRRAGSGSAALANARALTPRELEVVRLFVSGLTINEIAARLCRRKQTISAQKWNAMRKLEIERDADLIRYAIDVKLF